MKNTVDPPVKYKTSLASSAYKLQSGKFVEEFLEIVRSVEGMKLNVEKWSGGRLISVLRTP